MRERRLATHGMTYGVLALEACAIVGGVFMTVSALIALLATAIGAPVNGWTVVAIPGVLSAGALVAVWRVGFAPICSAMGSSVVQSVIIVGIINSLFTPMILGVALLPAGGVPLLWTVVGAVWGVLAVVAVVNSVSDWVVNEPTSVPLDALSIAATIAAIASAGVLLGSGMTGLLFGIVFLGGLFGLSAGLGFLVAEEPFDAGAHNGRNRDAAHTRRHDLARG